MEIENLNSFAIDEGVLQLSTTDPYLEVINGEAAVQALASGQMILLNDSFGVQVAQDVPDGHQAILDLVLTTSNGQWSRQITLTLNAADVRVANLLVDDGENGILEPGETVQLLIKTQNNGGASLHNVSATINCDNPDLTIIDASTQTNLLSGNSEWEAMFMVSLSESAPPMELLTFGFTLTADQDYYFYDELPLMTSIILENFETASFDLYDWEFTGEADWFITDEIVYEGQYSGRSGVIGDNYFSALSIDYQVAYDDSISFYYKVSSENNYDFLHFRINSQDMFSLSGEHDWVRAAYPVTAGNVVFNWSYEKDYSVSNGYDCAFLDYIVLPARAVVTGQAAIESNSVRLNVYPNPSSADVTIEVNAAKAANYRLLIVDAKGQVIYNNVVEDNNVEKNTFKIASGLLSSGKFAVCLIIDGKTIVKQLIRQ